MQARPGGGWGVPKGCVLQSWKVVQGPQVPLMQACPFWHSLPGPPTLHPVRPEKEQTPDWHDSPDVQSVSWVHVHCIPECVAAQVAVGPHWLFEVHAWQVWPMQTSPALHWLLVVQVEQPLMHSAQTSTGLHIPNWQNKPTPQSLFDVHGWPVGRATGVQDCPAGQLEHCAQLPPWQLSHAGQSVSP